MRATKFQNKYRIDSIRLENWDYSTPGFYFVTVCTKNFVTYLGDVQNGEVRLSEVGKVVKKSIKDTEKLRSEISIDKYVIMPNHIHLIIEILSVETHGSASRKQSQSTKETHYHASLHNWKKNKFGVQSRNLASAIRGIKTAVKRYANKKNIPFQWQPRYYDRVIRDDRDLYLAQEYIDINPLKWDEDKYNSPTLANIPAGVLKQAQIT